MSKIKIFQSMLDDGTDNALLRYSLGNAYYIDKQFELAAEHLQKAVELDESYSAAWKLLGKCYFESNDYHKAIGTYERGIVVAVSKGDKQAEKEMNVFLNKARKKAPPED